MVIKVIVIISTMINSTVCLVDDRRSACVQVNFIAPVACCTDEKSKMQANNLLLGFSLVGEGERRQEFELRPESNTLFSLPR